MPSPRQAPDARTAPAPDAEPAPTPASDPGPQPPAGTPPAPGPDRTDDAGPSPAPAPRNARPAGLPALLRLSALPRLLRRRASFPAPFPSLRPAGAGRPVLRRSLTLLAAAFVLAALLLPNTFGALKANRFTQIPGEAIVGAAILLSLPRRARRATAVLLGTLLGVLTVLNVLDLGFGEYLGRGFNLVLDWALLEDARGFVADSMGGTVAVLAVACAVALALLLPLLTVLAVRRLGEVLAADRDRSTRGVLIAGTVWITCSVLGLQLFGMPLATGRAAHAVQAQKDRVRDTIRDEAAFAREARTDAFGGTPPDQLVPDLRGKDVIFAFVESYGRSAIEDPIMAPGVNRTLETGTEALAAAGYRAKSGWLTSPAYGAGSWLGHSTFISGLWVDNQQRYTTVTSGEHRTLTKMFGETGAWDTVGVMPGVQKAWPEARFHGLDTVYNAFRLGYRGPKFAWSTMPDQYTLEAFQRLEHGRKRDKPLMAEIILTSSHQPWAPIPRMVGWDEVGDGSVFRAIQREGEKPADIIADETRSREEYGKTIEYSLTCLTQWLERYGTDDTVLVFLGDHQPISRVSGTNAGRDVPVTIAARDPKVLDAVADWGWTDGLRPEHDAPVWKMSAFRDRFLTAYGSTPHPTRG
uniref:CDP-alcohol phosphatidyltransferase n=1 Tax=Streptomyces sp. SCSIO 75703 TaxID=3112165 RepID=UPI00404013A2